jgi:CIC family chloride channel protein
METWLQRLGVHLPDRQHTRVLLLGVLVGALGGLSAGVLDLLIAATGKLVLGTSSPAATGTTTLRALLGPALTGLAAGFVIQRWAARGNPQGIPEVIEGIANARGHVPVKDAAVASVAAALAVGGGQSAGREGPSVQLAAAVASFASERMRVPPTTVRALVAGGAAAGIAASFNTPLGGAFFAMEVLLGSFALDAFAPVVVATVTGTVVGQALLGERLALALPPFQVASPVELLLFPALGIACGIVSALFRRLLRFTGEQLDRLPIDPMYRPALSGLAVGVVAALGLPHVMGNGYRRVEELITGAHLGLGMLLLILVAKMVATALSFRARSGGGLFAPSLFLGAVTGLIVGTASDLLLPGVVEPGAMGMVGMGAVAAAITHTPITMTLMLFEMTGNYAVILPLLVTIAIATLVARAADRLSIYAQALADRGVRLDRGEELVLYELRVDDVMRRGTGYATIAADAPFSELAGQFLGHHHDEVLVVDGERLVGLVDIQDVKGKLARPDGIEGTARGLARAPASVGPTDTLALAMERFFASGQDALPVIDEQGRLLGVVRERDVVGALNRELLRQDALMARVHHGPEHDRHRDYFELPAGYSLASVESGPLQGGTLEELNLPRRLGVMVLAVDRWDEDAGRHHRVPPRAALALGPRDRLIVMGPAEHLAELSRPDVGDVEVTVEVTRE